MAFNLARVTIIISSLLLAGCSLPTNGPRGESILHGANGGDGLLRVAPMINYCLIKATPENIATAGRYQYRLAGNFSDRRPAPTVKVGIGDVIGVTLFEAEAGGLFFDKETTNRQGNFLTLPNQTVDEHGNIFVPYAGSISASGQTRTDIQDAIIEQLGSEALNPQAIVTIVEQRNQRVSIIGDVNSANRIPVSASGERVLDAIAHTGGISGPGHETWVLLERRGKVAVAPFGALIHEPENNVYVRARDTIYVFREPQTFVAFGATSQQGHIPFGSWRLSLAEALGQAGGLNQSQADPSWVFNYRMERVEAVKEMEQDCEFVDGQKRIPVIYQFDLRDPSGFFLTQSMRMRNKDVMYVSNARSVEIDKFIAHLRGINGAIQDPISTAISVYSLKAAAASAGSASNVIIAQ